jgi:hypothetical protein
MVNQWLVCLCKNLYLSNRNAMTGPVALLVDKWPRSWKRRAISSPDNNAIVRVLGSQYIERKERSNPPVNLLVQNVTTTLEDRSSDASLVLLSWHSFVNYNANNFCCWHYFEPLATNRFERIQVCFAMSINYYCRCKVISKLKAETTRNHRQFTLQMLQCVRCAIPS